jgi:hypothetical protein
VPRKIRELKADLRGAGATEVSHEGSHAKWKHSLVPDLEVVLAGSDGADAKPYQEKQVRNLLRRIAEAQRRLHP